MISLEDAQARIVALARLLPEQTVGIGEAAGRWSAAPVIALRTQPARNMSAMDGYAVAGGSAGPWRIVGESVAGKALGRPIGPGEAARIFTGAALPEGTDAIIIQEQAERAGDMLRAERVPTGRHVREAGSDFRTGDVLIEAGLSLTPPRLALAATAGHQTLTVRQRPRVAILATGDELVAPGETCADDQLPESNSLMVAAMLAPDAEVRSLGIVGDDLAAITAAIRSADADLLITSGGASVGDHDLIRPALEACGAEMEFHKVAMRPGKPVMAGRIGPMMVLGLPGNPVSAYVTAALFALPLLRSMLGSSDPLPRLEPAILATPLPANGDRVDHLRAAFTGAGVSIVGLNDSAALWSLARANCLIRRGAGADAAVAGDEIHIIRL